MKKTDLDEIRKVVREEVEAEVKDSTRTLDHNIRLSRMEIQRDINELGDRMKNVEIRVEDVDINIKSINKSVKKIERTLDIVIKNYDEADVKLHRRVKRIEEHLSLSDKN